MQHMDYNAYLYPTLYNKILKNNLKWNTSCINIQQIKIHIKS
jgi:hypothetical protein